jgi:hypothetical protein
MAAVEDDVERNRNEWTPWRGRRVRVVVRGVEIVRRWEDDGGASLAPSAEANRRLLPDRCSLVGPTSFSPARPDLALPPSPIPRRRWRHTPTRRPDGADATNTGLCETRRTIAMSFDLVLNLFQSAGKPPRAVNWSTGRLDTLQSGWGSDRGGGDGASRCSFVLPSGVGQSVPVSTLLENAKGATTTSGGEDDESLGTSLV